MKDAYLICLQLTTLQRETTLATHEIILERITVPYIAVFFLALSGTDTTSTAVTCFLLVLLHYPNVQRRIQAEIDHVIGDSRTPLLEDRAKMPYTEACLMETLRLISHVPLAVPHATICDTSVKGMKIPKDTTVS